MTYFFWLLILNLTAEAASVRGRVTDSTGSPVAGATVVLSRTGDLPGRQLTNEEGEYLFLEAEPGVYSLRVTKAGFAMYQANTLAVGRSADVVNNVHLSVLGAARAVTALPPVNVIESPFQDLLRDAVRPGRWMNFTALPAAGPEWLPRAEGSARRERVQWQTSSTGRDSRTEFRVRWQF